MRELDSLGLVLYSELLDHQLASAYTGKGLSLFTRRVKGHNYWYLQMSLGASRRSAYLGPDTEAMREQVARARAIWQDAEAQAQSARRRVSVLGGLGFARISGAEFRVLQAMAQAGVFLGGGVLVGSHAFRALGNLLGVAWIRTDLQGLCDELACASPR